MQRYFISEKKEDAESLVTITGEDVHHISRVMRMSEGSRLTAITSDGYEAECKIRQISGSMVEALPEKWVEAGRELPVKVTIASGLPKGDKLEWIIQKGTELGASEFIPFNAARSIVKIEANKAKKKTERWQKIAKEAAEQSYRTVIPHVKEPFTIKQLLKEAESYTLKLLAFEESAKEGEAANFAAALKQLKPHDTILIVTGPEGGISDEEAALFTKEGFIPASFGPRILRTETAPLYALSAISFYFELLR
ncbi:16S rRNA (uracil(1498)-N(3))-methyltransferase [Metabacillus sp. GX 13764]|uniref:16S rRNA (uracil(1498)-N(3))-methyltransferase n=1 Tax=Metabacillus kandeliae TaxID=2900151 RepID=UPI001E4F806A|nr:16S rRNA (uracil(1498)-N(3))-methyltransferase [Metabacillus kandeliae]MCD7033045.1 16S rRNA (uracil(1498)-N(3))-methyltransferase [Metabacillus kandeliae]